MGSPNPYNVTERVVIRIKDRLAKLEASGDVFNRACRLRQLLSVHPDERDSKQIRFTFDSLEESYQFVSDLEAQADLAAFTEVKLLVDTLCPPKR